jgi:hypothetical protein
MKLQFRIARLEANRKPQPLRIFIVRAGQEETAQGFTLDGETVVLRKPGEELAVLQARAEKAIPDTRETAIFRPICTTTHEAQHYD